MKYVQAATLVCRAGAPGIEFVVQDAQPPHLFVIRKQRRSLAGAEEPIALYYILDATVYQAPNMHAVISARIARAVHTLRRAFDELRSDLDPLSQPGFLEAATEYEQIELTALAVPVSVAPIRHSGNVNDRRQRMERALLSTFLEHALPRSSASIDGDTAKLEDVRAVLRQPVNGPPLSDVGASAFSEKSLPM
jgi:mediator of RNA polymerase II transcription subunit 6